MLKKKSKRCPEYPLWYTEFSLLQLQYLKELKDTMFKDKEEQTTFRTLKALSNIGMITDVVKVDSRIIKKLLNEHNTDPIKFLYEIYKAISGNYFENEKFKCYSCSERIILSGIAFLELPKVVLELHKRLPPLIDIKCPVKPKRPKAVPPKKLTYPYLEKFLLPPNWRAYRDEFCKWHKKYLATVKPVAILPKKEKHAPDPIIIEEEKQETSSSSTNNAEEENYDKRNSTEQLENDSTVQEITENDLIKKNTDNIGENMTESHLKESSASSTQKQDFQPLQDWTEPPSPCPFKYRKLMDKVGPVNTDDEFFEELGYENKKKSFPAGRENLSVKMQSYLLGLETDLFKVTDDVNKLTCEVKTIAKEIMESEPKCDACCACRQTQKTHLESHTTKAPHLMIDAVATNKDNKTKVIGAMALHSPAASIASFGEPPCIPSSEKIVKNMIITGTTTTIDGERVKQVEGCTKVLEHISREILLPDSDVVDIKNVPPCKCSKEDHDKKADLRLINADKDVDMCYGRKFRPEEGPAYSCGEFKKKDIVEDDYECAENFEKYVMDDCGCGINFKKCTGDGEAEYENSVKSEFENVIEVGPEIKESCRICKRCGRKVNEKCMDKYARELDLSKKGTNKKSGKILTHECSCNSLSEFLQFDITKKSCSKPNKENSNKTMFKKKSGSFKHESKNRQKKLSINTKNIRKSLINITNQEEANAKEIIRKISAKSNSSIITSEQDKESEKLKVKKDSIQTESLDADSKTIGNEDPSLPEKQKEGPFGLKTSSEEALQVERTIAYLVPLHPPNHPAGQIPAKDGKRPCRCRENRNNRKTLLYNIGGLVGDGKKVQQEDSPPRVIEGITWLTPEPSIRRSDEYIPEYELYDSPYENLCARPKKSLIQCPGNETKETEKKIENCGVEKEGIKNKMIKSRSQDWDNAFNDPYLTELFTKKQKKLSCFNKCSKFPHKIEKPRKLQVMKAVCECKYERKIVKRNENRKKWFERQNRLKALKKEPYIHISEISRPVLPDRKSYASELAEFPSIDTNNTETKYCTSRVAEDNNMAPPQIVISAVTMQTPVATPTQSLNHSKSSITPISKEANDQKNLTPVAKNSTVNIDKTMNKNELSKGGRTTSLNTNKLANVPNEQNIHDESNQVRDSKIINSDIKEITNLESRTSHLKTNAKIKRSASFFDRLEENLKAQTRNELKKMMDEDFISVKLPGFYKMPQILYWISYRAKGMDYSNSYKNKKYFTYRFTNHYFEFANIDTTYSKELTQKSMKQWATVKEQIERKIGPKVLRVKKKDAKTLNFDRAIYWKKKISEYKLEYYTQLRHEIINLTRDVWPSMEFGKFPDIIFKQAYFTYLPSREKDAHVVRLWAE